MKKYRWVIGLIVGLLACFSMSLSFAQVQGIPPVASSDPDLRPTMHISDLSGDVTDTWLPNPNQTISITLQGITLSSVELGTVTVSGTSISTTAYPGECTNFGNPLDTNLDFSNPYDIIENSFKLDSKDSGGRFVIKVTNSAGNEFYFVGPRDDDLDGIPTYWESQNCPSGNCEPFEDIDIGPDGESSFEDGFANIDEFRGWRVKGSYVRGNPTVKDVFFHIEEELQCTDGEMGNWDDVPSTEVNLEYFFGANLDGLFANINTLSPLMNFHQIGSDEWVDHFESYDKNYGVILNDSPIGDRRVNQNAVHPLGKLDENSGQRFVKGVRAIQCLDLGSLSPIGLADKNPPNLFLENNGYGVIFVHRVINFILNEIKYGSPRKIKYKTFVDGKWKDQAEFSPADTAEPSIADSEVQLIIKIVLAQVFAHEIWNHAVDVRATAQSTRKASYGYHNAPGDGTVVDLKIEVIRDSKESGFTNFYIPLYYGTADKREIRVLQSQVVPQ